MGQTLSQKPHLKPAVKDIATADTFQNFLTRTGVGAGNIGGAGHYGFNPVTRNRVQMEWSYRGSWIVGMAVDAPAKDMTREGVEIQSDDKPDKIQHLQKEAQRLSIWKGICETTKWSRLYGGALGWLMIDGQDTASPLRTETIRQGQFKGIKAIDRWQLQPDLSDIIDDLGPDLGNPRFYDYLPDVGSGLKRMRIHYSRVLRMTGVELPYWQKIGENYWGQSVIERIWDRLISFDSGTMGAAQMLYKAHLRTYKVKDLRQIISTGGEAYEGLIKQINAIRAFQSNEGLTLMDADDEFEVHAYAFGGIDLVLLQLGQQLSGALGIPLVRLFGQSPAGLNSTGESDLRMYYDNIRAEQESLLRMPVETIYHVLYRSTFGAAPPQKFTLEFAPLWQMTDDQKADVTNKRTAATKAAFDSQIIDKPTALRELRGQSQVTGAFSHITDDQIKAAENEPAPVPGETGTEAAPATGAQPGRRAEEPASATQNPKGRGNLRAVS
jgi:hypothetical protein